MPTIVQSIAVPDFDATTVVASFSGATTPGNTIIVVVADADNTGGSISALVDDAGSPNSFTLDLTTDTGAVTFWRLSDCGAVTTVFGTVSSAGFTANMHLFEVSGLDLTSPLQESEAFASLDGGAFQVSHNLPYVTIAADEFVVGLVEASSNRTITATGTTSALSAGTTRTHCVYKISTTAESSNLTFDWNTAATADGAVVSYSAAAAGGSTRSSGLTLLGVG